VTCQRRSFACAVGFVTRFLDLESTSFRYVRLTRMLDGISARFRGRPNKEVCESFPPRSYIAYSEDRARSAVPPIGISHEPTSIWHPIEHSQVHVVCSPRGISSSTCCSSPPSTSSSARWLLSRCSSASSSRPDPPNLASLSEIDVREARGRCFE